MALARRGRRGSECRRGVCFQLECDRHSDVLPLHLSHGPPTCVSCKHILYTLNIVIYPTHEFAIPIRLLRAKWLPLLPIFGLSAICPSNISRYIATSAQRISGLSQQQGTIISTLKVSFCVLLLPLKCPGNPDSTSCFETCLHSGLACAHARRWTQMHVQRLNVRGTVTRRTPSLLHSRTPPVCLDPSPGHRLRLSLKRLKRERQRLRRIRPHHHRHPLWQRRPSHSPRQVTYCASRTPSLLSLACSLFLSRARSHFHSLARAPPPPPPPPPPPTSPHLPFSRGALFPPLPPLSTHDTNASMPMRRHKHMTHLPKSRRP